MSRPTYNPASDGNLFDWILASAGKLRIEQSSRDRFTAKAVFRGGSPSLSKPGNKPGKNLTR